MIENKNKQHAFQEIGYHGIYLERPGEHADELVERLMQPPELQLNEEQKQVVYDFEASLSQEIIGEEISLAQIIRNSKGEDVVAPLYFAQPFIDGTIDAKGYKLPDFNNEIEVYRGLATAVKNKMLSSAQMRTLATKSAEAYSRSITEKLVSGEELEPDDVQSRSIVLDPDELLKYSKQLESAREILHDYRKVYKEGGDRVDGAKRAVVDVYLARINEIMAQNIPRADYLIAQGVLIGDTETTDKGVQAIPATLRDAVLNFRTHKKVLKQLDYLRNGIAIDEDGNGTVVAEGAGQGEDETLNTVELQDKFTPEQKKILQNTMLAPEITKTIITNIIRKAGLLSDEDPSSWDIERKHRAKDGLFQVVSLEEQKTFAVDGISGVYKVASVPRSIYDVLTVAGFHELPHISQAQADRELGKVLHIAELKGKRVSMIREAGANGEQRLAEIRYFGSAKPFANTYPKALEAIENGEGMTGAIKAFYAEKRRAFPDMAPEKAASESANRVVRLIRQGGLSSQSMVYAEEAILNTEMAGASLEKRSRACAVTGLDLVDQNRLHKYGILPEVSTSAINWSELIMEELKPYIDQALKADQ